MSTESSKTIIRQWHIIWYLVGSHYVSTSNIREHLQTLGIEVELRTIQRDLNILEKVLPIECRRDSIPHSWRLIKPQETSAGYLSMTQALTVRLVEEQLKGVMSAKQIEELQPLFMRARFVTGMEQLEDLSRKKTTAKDSKPTRRGGGYGVTGAPSPLVVILHGIRSLVGSALDMVTDSLSSDDLTNNPQVLDAAVTQLIGIMRAEGLDELVESF
jgi:hypothetical protein